MPDSTFVYEQGEAIRVGSHGDHDFVFHEGTEVTDSGESTLVFEAGTGIGGGDIIDDWERGNLNPYTLDSGGGGSWSVNTNSPVFEGSYSLKIDANNESYKSLPGDGLTYYPQQGDVIEVVAQIGTDLSGIEMWFGAGDYDIDGPGYSFGMAGDEATGSRRIFIEEAGGSGGSGSGDQSVSFSLGTWYIMRLEWGSPTKTMRLLETGTRNEIGSVSYSDTAYDGNRGTGWDVSQSQDPGPWDQAVDIAQKVGTV